MAPQLNPSSSDLLKTLHLAMGFAYLPLTLALQTTPDRPAPPTFA